MRRSAGCDEELWSKVNDKRSLIRMYDTGDEEKIRRKVERIREVLEEQERAKETDRFIADVEREMSDDDAQENRRTAPERRIDTDGIAYTKAEYIEEYGGTVEWEAARRVATVAPGKPRRPRGRR